MDFDCVHDLVCETEKRTLKFVACFTHSLSLVLVLFTRWLFYFKFYSVAARYGCEIYTGTSYSDDQPYMYRTKLGSFQGFHCLTSEANPFFTFVYFQVFLVLSSWVIMSLFIGVISMGMFEAFEKMKRDNKMKQYLAKLEANQANSKKANKDKQKIKKEAQAAKMKQGAQGKTSSSPSSAPPSSSSGTPVKSVNPRQYPTKTIDGVEAKEEVPDHKLGLLDSMDNMVESVAEDWGDMVDAAGDALEEAAEDVEEFMDMLEGTKKTSLKEKIDYGKHRLLLQFLAYSTHE